MSNAGGKWFTTILLHVGSGRFEFLYFRMLDIRVEIYDDLHSYSQTLGTAFWFLFLIWWPAYRSARALVMFYIAAYGSDGFMKTVLKKIYELWSWKQSFFFICLLLVLKIVTEDKNQNHAPPVWYQVLISDF